MRQNAGLKPKHTLLFDLDGTLVDTEAGITGSLGHALDGMGIAYTYEQLRRLIGPPFLEGFPREFGVDVPTAKEAVAKYRAHYSKTGLYDCKVYPGIPELLGELRGRGVRLAVASSKPLMYVARILEEKGLADAFDFVGGAEMDGVRNAKAEVIAWVMEHLGLSSPEGCALIGDRCYDAQGAAQMHMDCIGVGFGFGSEEELRSAGVVAFAADVPDLRALLLNIACAAGEAR